MENTSPIITRFRILRVVRSFMNRFGFKNIYMRNAATVNLKTPIVYVSADVNFMNTGTPAIIIREMAASSDISTLLYSFNSRKRNFLFFFTCYHVS